MLYKYIENGIIAYVGESSKIPQNGVEITPEEKAQLEAVIASKPSDTMESVYRLSESGQYVAFTRTHEETVAWYVEKVNSGEITLKEVPDDYSEEVVAQIQPESSEDYLAGYDQAVLDMMGV